MRRVKSVKLRQSSQMRMLAWRCYMRRLVFGHRRGGQGWHHGAVLLLVPLPLGLALLAKKALGKPLHGWPELRTFERCGA